MKREEIEEAFCLACCEGRPHIATCMSLGTCAAHDRFIRLLKNPWHKASEELPKVDKYRKCIKVFARKGDDVFVAFYSVMAGFSLSSSFYTEYALSGVTHWMEIPELPKED